MSDPIERLIDDAREHLLFYLERGSKEGAALCESPIEVIFIQAMTLHSNIVSGLDPCFVAEKWRKEGWLIEPQKQILDYRVDFLISRPDIKTQLIVECDGHEFHERTKEQAAKDRSRDRVLTAAGYRVIRFTGSELWTKPWQCALDIEAQYVSMWMAENL